MTSSTNRPAAAGGGRAGPDLPSADRLKNARSPSRPRPDSKPLGLRVIRKVVYLPLDIRVQRDCDERVGASALPQVRWSLNATLTMHGLIEDSKCNSAGRVARSHPADSWTMRFPWNKGLRRPWEKWLSTVLFYTQHERKNKRKSLIIRHAPRWNRTNNPVIKSHLLCQLS
jgi:hypothetical protein